MPINLIPDDTINRVQKELRGKIPEPPPPANVRAVMDLGAATFFVFRDRAYIADPVPYRAGLRLQALVQKLQSAEAARKTDGGYVEAIAEAVALMGTLCRPERLPAWLGKRVHRRRNPFEIASERELGELLAFFTALRTKSSVVVR